MVFYLALVVLVNARDVILEQLDSSDWLVIDVPYHLDSLGGGGALVFLSIPRESGQKLMLKLFLSISE